MLQPSCILAAILFPQNVPPTSLVQSVLRISSPSFSSHFNHVSHRPVQPPGHRACGPFKGLATDATDEMTAKQEHALDFIAGLPRSGVTVSLRLGHLLLHLFSIFVIIERVPSDISVAYFHCLSRFSTRSGLTVRRYIRTCHWRPLSSFRSQRQYRGCISRGTLADTSEFRLMQPRMTAILAFGPVADHLLVMLQFLECQFGLFCG